MRFLQISLAVLALTLAACGSTNSAGTAPTAPAPSTSPAEPTPEHCATFRSSNCPEGCVSACVGSCDTCDDCDGPGSCHAPDATPAEQ